MNLTEREREKEGIIRDCLRKEITEFQASCKLGICIRQVAKMKARLRKDGTLMHGNCGRKPATTISDETESRILGEYSTYIGKLLNFKHFQEILLEDCGIKISYTALTNLLKRNGIKSPKEHRKSHVKRHPTRPRKEYFGELIQVDGTSYDWFDTGERQCLHVFIDDCRGVVTGLYMAKNECMQGYFEGLRQTFESYGLPDAIYGDGLSMFFSHSKQEPTIDEQLQGIRLPKTQFAKILDSLYIDLIHAHSPQAKGRVERKNGTFQGRLVAEFHRYGVKTIDQANDFFKWWLPQHNAKFGVNGRSESVFRELPADINLDYVLSYKKTRKCDKGGCFSMDGYLFQVLGLCNSQIEVLISKTFGVKAYFKGEYYDVVPISEGKKIIDPSESLRSIMDRFVAYYTLKNEHSLSA